MHNQHTQESIFLQQYDNLDKTLAYFSRDICLQRTYYRVRADVFDNSESIPLRALIKALSDNSHIFKVNEEGNVDHYLITVPGIVFFGKAQTAGRPYYSQYESEKLEKAREERNRQLEEEIKVLQIRESRNKIKFAILGAIGTALLAGLVEYGDDILNLFRKGH